MSLPIGIMMLAFALAIYLTKSSQLVFAFAVIWLLLAIIQFIGGFGFFWLFILAIINGYYAISTIKEYQQYTAAVQ
ncbi:MAG: hypothetical protein QME14_04455 [Methanobacteriaceae archaeon]|nr:hypothetical protein [Methanobacteriaceae archaeon]